MLPDGNAGKRRSFLIGKGVIITQEFNEVVVLTRVSILAGIIVLAAGFLMQKGVRSSAPCVEAPPCRACFGQNESNYEGIADHLGKDGKYEIHGRTPGRYILGGRGYAPFASGRKPRALTILRPEILKKLKPSCSENLMS